MRRGDISRRAARSGAQLLLALGLLIGIYIGYQLVGTDLLTDQAQSRASTQLSRTWSDATADGRPARAGDPIARISIPRLGAGWSYTILEGTDQSVLADGPGHYVGTPLPGQPGNVAVAGHRVGQGSPFDGLGSLEACDDISVETRTAVLTYRVLPTAASDARCTGIPALDPAYNAVQGREIVSPEQVDVLAAVPNRPDARPTETAPLLTLTTCHPRFSARQRMVIHAFLVDTTTKNPPEA